MILIAEPAGPAAQADDGSLSPGRRGVPLVDSDGHGGRLPPALWNPSNLNSAANLRFASVKGPGGQVGVEIFLIMNLIYLPPPLGPPPPFLVKKKVVPRPDLEHCTGGLRQIRRVPAAPRRRG